MKPFQSAKNRMPEAKSDGAWPRQITLYPDVRYVSKSVAVSDRAFVSQRVLFGGISAKSANRNWLSRSTTTASCTRRIARAEYSGTSSGTSR